jgi:cytochrome P450
MRSADDATPRDPYLEMLSAEDPYPLIHELRAEDPVHFVAPFGFWYVTRHDDVKRLFNDPDECTGDRRAWQGYVPPEEGSWMRWVADNSFFAMPAEDHARIRKLVSAAFKPRAIQRMDRQIREVVDQYAGPLENRRGEVIDLLGEFTNIVPNVVISRITGIPPGDDEDRFREIAQSVIAGFLPFTPPDVVEQANRDFQELSDYIRSLYHRRRESPRDDMISDLVHAQEDDEKLSENDVVILMSGLIAAGSETTALGGMGLIATLLQNPDAMEELRADRSLIPKALNEIIRFTFGGPMGLPRYAVRDFTLRGKEIRKGQMLMLAFGGANRDPAVYENPDVLDIHRDPKDLVTFGHGPHYCLGAHLARQEMGCMIDSLLDILPPGSTVDPEAMEFRDAGLFKRPLNLPVRIPDAEPR